MESKSVARYKCEQLEVLVYADRLAMGKAAAAKVALLIQQHLDEEGEVNIAFAAAPSQNEFLDALGKMVSIPWERIRAFHLDEYLGLTPNAPQRFSYYLRERIFGRVPFMEVHYIDLEGKDPPEVICARYRQLLDQYPLHIACIGIGENGHIAFNDPPVADFEDPCKVKVVRLDEACRRQQVHDGCFSSLERVPTHAVTLTIPAIMAAKAVVCVVPGGRKRKAVKRALEGPITTECPASILRKHPQAVLFLDQESASLILGR
ncbi:MAG: glucosamine-6-phosphate deaminase [Candidatus Methanomethyliaceae archaeon]